MYAPARKVIITLLVMDVKTSTNARLVLTSAIKPHPDVKIQVEATLAFVYAVLKKSKKTNVLVSVEQFANFTQIAHYQ